jgi:hypothetical protein
MTLDKLRMSMESLDLLALRIESGSGFYWFDYFIYAYVEYDRLYYDIVYGSLMMLH